ncbi:pyridoxamine 5'-phosphate oxidase family protein [Halocatena pleomorpha]|uniref:Pyridoxamine 5'-phosphate oxidase family protein n=1 Tax=Halocatena pleomorpha TaxID=1785090 RepID=A0A3P3R5H3_9EURY|nr:pyridoxamine 5'-phosphate oxidase family protein [Halocatena pleomorpha]RRJ28696.1 pyridoxamine 5'-phosphate oxidase family protein [Halocatena pleomorpha]
MGVPSAVADRIRDADLVAYLATPVNGRPHVAPVWYGYDDGVLSVLTTGKKLANIRQNPQVAVSIEQHTAENAGWMVTLLGTATVADEAARVNEAAWEIFPKYIGPDDATWPDYLQQALTDDPPESLVEIEIEIASATATQLSH